MSGVARILGFMQSAPDGFASIEEAHALVAKFRSESKKPDGASRQSQSSRSGMTSSSASNPAGLWRNLRPHPRDSSRLVWHWDPRMVALWAEHFKGTLGQDGPVRHGALRAAQQLRIPVLLVRGARSDVLSSDGAQAFAAAVPHAETADVARASHAVVAEQNDLFATRVLDFLRRNYPPRS
eukprot:TRINITY_DN7502_c0_g1_i2.p1 TRINITY_DN7502_c0_g1~~TRINITY_DN7502_c0_g1_i2.p1  ORF type:complete len:181 (+),score=20.25 TRINITY_DN7502_c0_g1_i2:715-1257(+)